MLQIVNDTWILGYSADCKNFVLDFNLQLEYKSTSLPTGSSYRVGLFYYVLVTAGRNNPSFIFDYISNIALNILLLTFFIRENSHHNVWGDKAI